MNGNRTLTIAILFLANICGMQFPITFSERFQLIHDFMRQTLEKRMTNQTHRYFLDHPKAIVRYLLTGNIIYHKIDKLISDEQFILDYITYEYALERNKQLRNTLGIRLTLDPRATAQKILHDYRKPPCVNWHILSTMRAYLPTFS